jgi:hypothetical protein
MVKTKNTFNNDPAMAPFALRFCCLVAEDDAQAAAREEVSQFFTESTPTPVFSEYRRFEQKPVATAFLFYCRTVGGFVS